MEIFCMSAGVNSSCPISGYGGSESNLRWMKVLDTFVQIPDDRVEKCIVISKNGLVFRRCGVAPALSHNLDHAEHHQAEPEVHEQPEVDLKGHMARLGRKMLHQQKVGCVPGEDRRQSMHKIGR